MTMQKFNLGSCLILAGVLLLLISLPSCAPPRGVYHTVQRGQNLYRISKVYAVEEDSLARVNRLRDKSTLQVGQRLFIPGANRILAVPATPSAPAVATPRPPKVKPSGIPSAKPVGSAVKEKSAKPASLPPIELRNVKGKFLWPVKGTVIKGFGNNNGGSVSKGLEISAPSGSVVRASAAGKVTYSGNGIKGYGNLIILKHDESFFTVYGFNQENLVHTGEYVGKEQQIALSGLPPGGDSPRLHFEIRRGKEALDPLHFLP